MIEISYNIKKITNLIKDLLFLITFAHTMFSLKLTGIYSCFIIYLITRY
jgi:hypothetical protein